MPDFGATPTARTQRIRAGILLPFWQDLYSRLDGVGADPLMGMLREAIGSTEILLMTPDRPELFDETLAELERWAMWAERPSGRALMPESFTAPTKPRKKPGSPDSWIRGAFAAWLKSGASELQFYRDEELIDVTVISDRGGAPASRSISVNLDEIPQQSRVAGARAVRDLLKELQNGS